MEYLADGPRCRLPWRKISKTSQTYSSVVVEAGLASLLGLGGRRLFYLRYCSRNT